jgi:hypothetical protein
MRVSAGSRVGLGFSPSQKVDRRRSSRGARLPAAVHESVVAGDECAPTCSSPSAFGHARHVLLGRPTGGATFEIRSPSG